MVVAASLSSVEDQLEQGRGLPLSVGGLSAVVVGSISHGFGEYSLPKGSIS